MAAAGFLRGKAEFRMVGPINTTSDATRLLGFDVTLIGAVPRSEVHYHFAWADIFLLPSICEGSATACYEALAYGLPVIATPNTGSVVRDGVDGFIVPIRDPAAIAERIERLADDRELLAAMSNAALERSSEYTIDEYGKRLLSALANNMPRRSHS
jgi:glycosyltransferase involved in cell wall biosynthesis